MTEYEQQKEEKSIYAISFLLEFYEKEVLRRFCKACRDQKADINHAFIMLKGLLLQHLAFELDYPSFEELAAMYAKRMDLSIDEIAKLLKASGQQ
ncbi:hypothetical protein BVX97_01590 [bacterium E08(2017)]|nr:hypothetical protein BVX97_01590 [bacterium E08(2017)]